MTPGVPQPPPAAPAWPEALPLYTAEAVREADRRAIEERGVSGLALMQQAGRGAFAAALARYPVACRGRVVVLAGRGHNGGDGFVFARCAREAGAEVAVVLAADGRALAGDPARARDQAVAAGVEVVVPGDEAEARGRLAVLLGTADLAVDALLGTGSRGAPRGAAAAAIEVLNAWRLRTGRPVVALDLPSGLDADRGTPQEPCVRADLTATFGALKVGLVQGPALAFAGVVHLVPLDIPPECYPEPAAWLLLPAGAAARLPAVAPDVHKGDRGRLWIAGGSRGMTGAAVLAARGALRSGAGVVHVAVPAQERPIVAAAVSEAVTFPLPDAGDGTPGPWAWQALRQAAGRADALVVGPGLGRSPGAAALVRSAWAEAEVPAVFDADALFALAELARAGELPAPGGPRVLTPHAGEAARLLDRDAGAVQADRLAAARALAERYGAVAVLKGARTVVAEPGGAAWVNPTGSPALATGGTGDVLAGVIGALLARGAAARDAALVSVFAHGRAGQRLALRYGPTGVVAGDLPAAVARALELLRRLDTSRDPVEQARVMAECGFTGVL